MPHGKSNIRFSQAASLLAVIGLAASSASALPPFAVSRPYVSGMNIPGVGAINSPFNFNAGESRGGDGFVQMSINNAGTTSLVVGVFAPPAFGRAVLYSPTGMNAVFAAGAEGSLMDPGSVTLPSTEYVFDNGFSTSINNNGDVALSMGLRSSEFASVTPITGVYFNKTALPIKEGDPVTAAGVAPGTTFGAFSTSGMIRFNDNNVVMIAGPIVEGGITKNAIIKAALDSSGAQLTQTLVAKEGGPAAGGPATWTFLSVAAPTCAMNNSGDVLFSGITSSGQDGICLNNAFVATMGGAAPGSQIWASLYKSPLDLAHSGQFAFRGLLQGSPVWTESPDAGEGMSNGNGGGTAHTVQVTTGGGSLTRIDGILSNDQDVDLYQITVDGGPNEIPFSATCVPDPGSGFAGANFDSVLYLFAYGPNMNGNGRAGLGRCDNLSPTVLQSALTTSSLSANHYQGRQYILGISTPKSRCWSSGLYGGGTPTQDMWSSLPAQVAVGSNAGMIFWADPSNGSIGRSSLSSATLLGPLSVVPGPMQTNGTQQDDGRSALLREPIAVYDAPSGSKVFFFQYAWGNSKIYSCNTDGTGVTEVINNASSPPLSGLPNASSTQALAVDSVNSVLYWSNSSGKVNKSNLDGSGNVVFADLATLDPPSPNSVITAVAVDTKPISNVPGTGRVYWYDSTNGAINRRTIAGGPIQGVASVPALSAMTIDPVGRRLYYTVTSSNLIKAINLDSPLTAVPDLAAPTAPVGISFDPGANNVYVGIPSSRKLQRTPIASPAMQDWTSAGPDVGEQPAYGAGAYNGFSGFVRNGTPGVTSLPYSIKLTGAIFNSSAAMICRNNTVNVDGGLGGNSPGGITDPVMINDSGVVIWNDPGVWADQTQLLSAGTIIISGNTIGQLQTGSPSSMAASDNCQHILVKAYNGSFDNQSQSLLQIDFDSVPGNSNVNCCRGTTCNPVAAGTCTGVIAGSNSIVVASCGGGTAFASCCYADFNHDGIQSIDDLFLYFNAYFTSSPYANFAGDGVATPTIDDLFLYINAYFGTCS